MKCEKNVDNSALQKGGDRQAKNKFSIVRNKAKQNKN